MNYIPLFMICLFYGCADTISPFVIVRNSQTYNSELQLNQEKWFCSFLAVVLG